MKIGDLQVWWIPQIGGNQFVVNVKTVTQGALLLDTLAHYDIFQFENRIKPDYSNAGGLQRWCEDDGEGRPGWEEWYDEETDEDDPLKWLESLERV